MQKLKAVANRYKIHKTLFKVNYYVYAQIFDKHTLDTLIGCVYLYENEQPGQILKMLRQKFPVASRMDNLIFPQHHVKDNQQQKSVSIFFLKYKIIPLQLLKSKQLMQAQIPQILKFTYDALCSLHYLHSYQVIHGNISLNTCYLVQHQRQVDFALNILDTNPFHQQLLKSHESFFFRSQAQHRNQNTSYKDDAESIIYVLVHIASKGRLFTKERYNTQWCNQEELLRWKTMDFFKEMVDILPIQLDFLSQIFVTVKALSKNQKPDYPKFIKKTYLKLKQRQNIMSKSLRRSKPNQKQVEQNQIRNKRKQTQKNEQQIHQQEIKRRSQRSQRLEIQKRLQRSEIQQKLDEQSFIFLVDDEVDQDNQITLKFQKLEHTKAVVKTKNFQN